jgi:hypothetical protein
MPKLGAISLPKINGGSAKFQSDIAAQNRRTTGVTPKVVDAFQSRPYRYLRKATSLSNAGGGVGLQRLAKGSL